MNILISMDEIIGRNLRNVRQMRGISQRQLGIKSGVSNATISLIENHKTTPSVGVLKKILSAIPMSVSEFFTLEFKPTRQCFFRHDELVEVGSSGLSFLQVGKDLKNHRLQIFIERYPPGSDTGAEHLCHEGEEGGVIVEGFVEATIGSETKKLSRGDAFYFDSQTPHRFRNTGRADCVLISARTPPSF